MSPSPAAEDFNFKVLWLTYMHSQAPKVFEGNFCIKYRSGQLEMNKEASTTPKNGVKVDYIVANMDDKAKAHWLFHDLRF
ncbi:hypothetical protein RUND412_005605, partial [Rhizina undulata]